MTAPTPSCKTCQHSAPVAPHAVEMFGVLWCALQNNEAVSVCEHYSREVGSDDE
jgi:hypothetical protein